MHKILIFVIVFITILSSCKKEKEVTNYDFSKNSINIDYKNDIWENIPFSVFYKLHLSPKTVYKITGETLIKTTYNEILIKFSFNLNFHRLESIIEYYKYRYNLYTSDFKIETKSINGNYDPLFFEKKYSDIMNVLSFEIDLNSFGNKKIYISDEHFENFDLKYFEYQIFHIIDFIYPQIIEDDLKKIKYNTKSIFYPIIFNSIELNDSKSDSLDNINIQKKEDLLVSKNRFSEIKPSFESFLESFSGENLVGNRVFIKDCGCYSDIKVLSSFSKKMVYESKDFEYSVKNFYQISKVN